MPPQAITPITPQPEYLGGETIGKRLRQVREAQGLSVEAVADLAVSTVEEIRACETDAYAAGPRALGTLLHAYGLRLGQLLKPEFPVPDVPLLRQRPAGVAGQQVGLALARGLYLARTWRDLVGELASTRTAEVRPDALPEDDFGRAKVSDLRARLRNVLRLPRQYAETVREFFHYNAITPFHVRDRANSLGIVVIAFKFPRGTPFDGCFQTDHGAGPIILVNLRDRPPQHAAFVIAHELCHFILGDVAHEFHFARSKAVEEEFCDRFADHLLLPVQALHERAGSIQDRSVEAVREFVRGIVLEFKVSRAVLVRQCVAEKLLTRAEIARACALEGLYAHPAKSARKDAALPHALARTLEKAVDTGLITKSRADELAEVLT